VEIIMVNPWRRFRTLGVLPPGGARKSLEAHASIEHEGALMFGQIENLSDYAVLSAARGR
jgi:hypothetical protein